VSENTSVFPLGCFSPSVVWINSTLRNLENVTQMCFLSFSVAALKKKKSTTWSYVLLHAYYAFQSPDPWREHSTPPFGSCVWTTRGRVESMDLSLIVFSSQLLIFVPHFLFTPPLSHFFHVLLCMCVSCQALAVIFCLITPSLRSISHSRNCE